MEIKKSPVVFNEDEHSYRLGDRRLLGITGLIHSVLGLGVYPEASEYTQDYIIPRAGSRGTAVHHAIQIYDQLGITQTTQTVRTKYGNRMRDNEHYVDETWDVAFELECYIRHSVWFEPLANELTVSDNNKWASQIDNVWLNTKTGGVWLVDTKTNNVDLYPLCGYFIPDYFDSGEQALKEYLSWQLSIYAVLFEMENPGIKVEGLACNWLRKDDHAFWVIERKTDDIVRELLKADYTFTDNGPIYHHPHPELFGIGNFKLAKRNDNAPVLAQEVVDYVSQLIREAAEIDRKLKAAKEGIKAAMVEHGVKKADFGSFAVTLSDDTTATSFNTAKFKKDHPELYKEYLKTSPKKGAFTLKAKDTKE